MQLKKMAPLLLRDSKKIEMELIEIRRYLHQNPELSFQEYQTSAFVESKLNELGISNKRIGKTGIVAWIEGEKESSGVASKTIGLRADMDALPITEKTGLPFSSRNNGVMHACGHDGHTTILLGAARLLQKHKASFGGKVICIFQPGEEEDGAAKEMIELGVLTNPNIDAMLALHLWPYLPFGVVGVRGGSMTASCDDFTIKVTGKSGHSARPHEGVDAIAVSIQIYQAIQHLVMKMYNPLDPIVVHFGKIQGGLARNIIADEVVLEGTTRALSTETRKKLAIDIEELVTNIASSCHAEAELEYKWGHAPVTNDIHVTNLLKNAVHEQLGEDMVVELSDPSLGADDFGDFSQEVPSSYFRLGIKKNNEKAYSLHHPKFSFDDQLVSHGAAIFAFSALKVLKGLED